MIACVEQPIDVEELSLDVMGGYGLTESHGIVSLTRPGDAAEVVAQTVGTPLEGLDIRVVDDDGTNGEAVAECFGGCDHVWVCFGC